jgi:hypothetical protein
VPRFGDEPLVLRGAPLRVANASPLVHLAVVQTLPFRLRDGRRLGEDALQFIRRCRVCRS